MRRTLILLAAALLTVIGLASDVAGADEQASATVPSLLALTTSEGQFAQAGWRCADPSGLLPVGVDPIGAACVRTFASTDEAPLGLRPASSIADLQAAMGSGRPTSPPPTGPGTWKLAPRTEPLRRTGAQIAADPVHHQVVLFGGYRCQGASCFPTGDTWTWNGTAWIEQHPATSPPARSYGSMTFDPASERVLLFGGVGCADSDCDALVGLGDTWTWDGTTWEKRNTLLSPPARYLAAMAGDAAAGDTVLFGGCIESCPTMAADTWSWDGSSWTLRTPAASPSARAAAGIAYDAARRELVLFGGSTPDTTVTHQDAGDTWTWDGSTWTPRTPVSSPSPREAVGMAYDAARGAIVLYGGFRSDQRYFIDAFRQDTWLWDGTAWTEQAGATSPPRTESPGLAYDDVSGKTLFVGGLVFSPLDSGGGFGVTVHEKDTWLLDGTGWTKVPPTWPGERQTAGWGGMGYYPKTKSDILTSGYCVDSPTLSCMDTWSWNGTRWTQLFLPHPNGIGTLVYSRKTRQFLGVFGPATFVFDGKDWTLADLNGPRLVFATAAPDSTGSVIQFGGVGYDSMGRLTSIKNDTYRWNGRSWAQLSPMTSPPGREIFQMAYDPVRHRTVVFGGIGCGKPTPTNSCPFAYLDDTWTWDGSTWTEQHPSTSPPNHAFGALVNDPGIQRSLLFGGVTLDALGFASSVNDTWSWDGTTWTQEQPATSPGNLLRPFAAELPTAGTAVLFGGQQDNPGRSVGDLWTWSTGG